jgi:hypothetical protein
MNNVAAADSAFTFLSHYTALLSGGLYGLQQLRLASEKNAMMALYFGQIELGHFRH